MVFYRNTRDPVDGGDVFASLLFFLVIVAVVAMLAVYVGLFILFIFLWIGVGLSFLYSVIIYFKALKDSIPIVKTTTGKGPITTIFLKFFVLLKETSLLAFKGNLKVAHHAIVKAHSYRFFSFRKWMWLIVAPAVLVFGTALILFLAFLQFQLLALCLFIIVIIIAAIIFGCAAVYLFAAIIQNVFTIKRSSGGHLIHRFEFSRSSTFGVFADSCKLYWSDYFAIINGLYTATSTAIKTNCADAVSFGVFHIKRYGYLGIVLSRFVASLLVILCVTIIRIIVFIPLILVNGIWTAIASIINR